MLILQYNQQFRMNNYQPSFPLTSIFIPKPLIFLILMLLQINPVYNCNSYKSGNQQCQICQRQNDFSCAYFNSQNGGIKINESACLSLCCDKEIFPDASSCPICDKQAKQYERSLADEIIILVFLIFVSVSLIISLRTCYKNISTQQQKDKQEEQANAATLAKYKMEDIAPLYQDKAQTCSICLESECNIRTRCCHSYHSYCLNDWVGKQQKCPLCISVQFNPVVIYCKVCFRQSKMVMLTNRISAKQKQIWQNSSEYSCNQCGKYNLSVRDCISREKKDLSVSSAQKLDSQARII